MSETTCPNCAARVAASAALCPRCDHDLARWRAEEADKAAASAPSEPSTEYRHGRGPTIFLAVVAAAFLVISGLMAYAIVFGSFPDEPGNIGFAITTFIIAVLIVWVVVRRTRVAFVTTPRALVRGKLVIPYENLWFASGTRVSSHTGGSTTSLSFFFRNRFVKGAILIPGMLRDREALVDELVAASGIGDDLAHPLTPHCPYCGEVQEADWFVRDTACSTCGKSLVTGTNRLNENTRRVFTGNRAGLIVSSALVAVGLGIYFYALPRIWEQTGAVMAVLLSLFISMALIYTWSLGWQLYANERRQIRLIDVMRRDPPHPVSDEGSGEESDHAR